MPEYLQPAPQTNGHEADRPTLNAAVQRRRADADFFRRVRDAMEQNRHALDRLSR